MAERLPMASPRRFYELLNQPLEAMDFARQVWAICAPACADARRGDGRALIQWFTLRR
jgi:hypothetical protein